MSRGRSGSKSTKSDARFRTEEWEVYKGRSRCWCVKNLWLNCAVRNQSVSKVHLSQHDLWVQEDTTLIVIKEDAHNTKVAIRREVLFFIVQLGCIFDNELHTHSSSTPLSSLNPDLPATKLRRDHENPLRKAVGRWDSQTPRHRQTLWTGFDRFIRFVDVVEGEVSITPESIAAQLSTIPFLSSPVGFKG